MKLRGKKSSPIAHCLRKAETTNAANSSGGVTSAQRLLYAISEKGDPKIFARNWASNFGDTSIVTFAFRSITIETKERTFGMQFGAQKGSGDIDQVPLAHAYTFDSCQDDDNQSGTCTKRELHALCLYCAIMTEQRLDHP
jgi:hypothetical protein